MQKLHSSLWVSTTKSGAFNGVLTWVTPSSLFCVGAASQSLSSALSSPVVRSYCKEMCLLKPGSWVYIDDLASEGYNHRYAQVLGPQGSRGSKAKRYGCSLYGLQGKEVYDRAVHHQMFRTVSLSVRNLFKVEATVAAVRIYADEPHPADAVQFSAGGDWSLPSYVSEVRIPAGLLGCVRSDQLCPIMKDTGMPLILQDVEMIYAGEGTCSLASDLKMPAIYLIWDGGEFDQYWRDHAGPHLVFRADGVNFFIEDMAFVSEFMRFLTHKADILMYRGGFSELVVPSLFNEFEKEYHIQASPAVHENQRFETPLSVDEEVAASLADVEWTEHVEKRIHTDLAAQPGSEPYQSVPSIVQPAVDSAPSAEKIHILRFGSLSNPGDAVNTFRQELLHGSHLRPCRDALTENGLSFVLPQEALMVVTPEQYAEVKHALKDTELHPFHLIVAEQFEYLIEEILADFPCKRRPRVKGSNAGRQELCSLPKSPRMEPDEEDTAEAGSSCKEQAEASGQSETGVCRQAFIEMRTFLCEAPVLKSDASVSCQSTTEVHVDGQFSHSHYGYRRGLNPRRFA
ncbi:unnamed protein product [Prorocentrum cordatum]|uniref:Rhodanese domain-containing protein n=1 Tax=Prorocentrum cordatum TaxID=2364126 RepID=A0ABN9WWD1_9DINO|nr:unnamed protein product [Polarella glacialis]